MGCLFQRTDTGANYEQCCRLWTVAWRQWRRVLFRAAQAATFDPRTRAKVSERVGKFGRRRFVRSVPDTFCCAPELSLPVQRDVPIGRDGGTPCVGDPVVGVGSPVCVADLVQRVNPRANHTSRIFPPSECAGNAEAHDMGI